MAKPINIIIDRFNGLSNFCRLTGYPTSTVHNWSLKEVIPYMRDGQSVQAHILAVAKEHGIPLEAGDFVDTSPPIAPPVKGRKKAVGA